MTDHALAAVKATLDGYADRGVLGAVAAVDNGAAAAASAQFNLIWNGGRALHCVFARPVLTLRNFLPAIDAGSDLRKALQKLIVERTRPGQPEHRAIDPMRAKVRTNTRGGWLSISIESLDGDYVYATQKLFFLAHEIWLCLQSDWADYMWDHLDAPVE
jgi:hypothetical protein